MVKSFVIWVIRVPWQSKQNGAAVDVSAEIVSYSHFYWKKYDCNWVTNKASQQVLLQYVSHTAETDKVSLVLWSMVSQNLRPLGAARTMWVYFALCQQSTLKKSKLRVRLVLEVLAKLMVGENSSWEFPKVGVRLILEERLILETRR